VKRLLFISTGAVAAACLVILIAFLLGALFGPLYHGEDESSRNFEIFLVVLLASIISGGFLANRLYHSKFKSGP
jgi:hypothetical protein